MSPVHCPIADADIVSAYVAAFAHIGGWGYLTQPGRRETDVTTKARRLVDLAEGELISTLLDPAFYRRWRATIVQVNYAGERGPYQKRGEGELDHLVVGPLHCSRPVWTTLYDWLLGGLASGKAPELTRAVREISTGKALDRERRHVRTDLTVGPDDDPAVILGRYRQEVKSRGETRLADGLRVQLNTAFYGLFGQEDGRFHDPVLAATIPAVVRCWLGVAEHMIRQRGGVVANRDTDGLAVPCSSDGGSMRLPDGTELLVLSWAQLDEVLGAFDDLAVFGPRFWSVDR